MNTYLILPLILVLALSSITARSAPTTTEILEYTATTLLTNTCAFIKDSENNPHNKEFFSKQYLSILYILWFSTQSESPIPRDILASYSRAFNQNAKALKFLHVVNLDDPLRIETLSSDEISAARLQMIAGPYWDWVIAKNTDKNDYKRFVSEFKDFLNKTK